MTATPHAKITRSHLERKAYVYIRQSSPAQVQHHRESQELQYGLTSRAQHLGWPETAVVVIDEDLGLSGRSAEQRMGFQQLVADVTLGRVGIILGIEVSRLARNNRDWYTLLDLCALFDTLIADSDGVYHPSEYNDRLLLGLKGTLSEAELHVMRGRLHAGLVNKARKGELTKHLPVGFLRNNDNKIVKNPDEAVQRAVTLVFEKFDELHSVRQVYSWFLEHDIMYPRLPDLKLPTELVWKRPSYHTFHHVLSNPTYAGAYFFGRKRLKLTRTSDGTPRFQQFKLPMEEWQVLIPQHHEGYLTWDKFLHNQAVLRGNRRTGGIDEKSRPGRGAALLQGLVRCGRCGRKMHVAYGGSTGNQPRYTCRPAPNAPGEPECQSIGGSHIDGEVARAFLEAAAPARVDATLEALQSFTRESNKLRQHWDLQIEKASYEAERARRQYDAVEPENRLVARTLEKRWNEKLERVEVVRQQAKVQCGTTAELQPEVVQRLQALGANLEGVWHAPSTTQEDRKNLLRTLVEEVAVTIKRDQGEVEITILWRGGSSTLLKARARRKGQHRCSASEETVDLVRRLAHYFPDDSIASILNKQGHRTGHESRFTAERVQSLRKYHNILPYLPASEGNPQRYNVAQAARMLGVSNATIHRWLQLGWLKGFQVTPHAPWVIHITEEDEARLKSAGDADGSSLTDLARRLGLSREIVLKKIQAGELQVRRVQDGRRSRWIVEGATLSADGCEQPTLFEYDSL